jgi:predicted secreted hydrolase
MKSRRIISVLLILLPVWAQQPSQWKIASPAYRYEFPRDHFNHPEFQTEWWYYTGNLRAADGHRFGFELTFFRTGIHLPKRVEDQSDPVWRPDQIYLAHLALSDIDGRRFFHSERLNRAGPGLAGCSIQDRQNWNGNWQVSWKTQSSDAQLLQAVAPEFTLQLDLQPQKPPVIQGQNGISQKGPDPSQASHYISFTRIGAKGTLQRGASTLKLDGLAWMDHEFFSESRNSNLAGWDWFAIQLDNNEELMLYRLRQKSGNPDPYSSGTFVDTQGRAHFLSAKDFVLSPGAFWESPHSKARYPLEWGIDVPAFQLHLRERTELSDQELYSRSAVTPSYWEGAVTYSGKLVEKPVSGVGYLEMTGYDKPVWLRQR